MAHIHLLTALRTCAIDNRGRFIDATGGGVHDFIATAARETIAKIDGVHGKRAALHRFKELLQEGTGEQEARKDDMDTS